MHIVVTLAFKSTRQRFSYFCIFSKNHFSISLLQFMVSVFIVEVVIEVLCCTLFFIDGTMRKHGVSGLMRKEDMKWYWLSLFNIADLSLAHTASLK